MDNLEKWETTKAIFEKEGKFLFLEEPDHRWELPGGKVEKGHSHKETLMKELKEELGLNDVKIGELVYSWKLISNKYNLPREYTVLCFAARFPRNQKIKLSDEHINYKWLTIKEIDKLNAFQEFKDTIHVYKTKKIRK